MLPLKKSGRFEGKIWRYHSLPAPPPPPAAAPPPHPPPEWDVAAAGPPDLGSALLYWSLWLDDGWPIGRFLRRCWLAPFTHVVGYQTPTTAFAGEVDSLLDAASYGSRWVSLTRVDPYG